MHALARWSLVLVAVAACGDSSSPTDGPPSPVDGASPVDAPAPLDHALPIDGAALSDAAPAPDAAPGTPPGAFTLVAPSSSPTVSTTPTLSWTASAGADSYTVEVATGSTFGAGDYEQVAGVTGTSTVLAMPLVAGTIYDWRVTAKNAAGSTVASNAPLWMSSPIPVGANASGIAVTPDGKTAVVANGTLPGAVTLVTLAAGTTQKIALAGQPSNVAITPDGSTALVTEGSPNNLVEINLAGKAIAGTVSPPCVATTLYGVAVLPSGSAAVMPDFNGGCTGDVLDVIALPGTAITKAISLGTSATAFGVAVTPDGSTALVTRGITTTSIRSVNLASGTVSTIANTSASFGVAVTPDGKTALVASGDGDTVKIVSLASGTVTGSIDFATNGFVGNIAITPDGKDAVAVGDFQTAVLSIAGASVSATYAIAGVGVAVTPDGARALVTGAGSAGVVYAIALR